uniref:Ribosome assembly factor mrt4 n=1 Tax=Panagrolaimus superbus TaxID=310955 RepID=A0A914YI93_9BILA
MPKSKRDKEISLTKVKKKTRENKNAVINRIQDALAQHKNIFVFSIDSMRSTKMTEIRQKFKETSRFFYGKNTVMSVALGRDAATEKEKGLHKVSQLLKGQCGLMFTNENGKNVIKFFKEYSENDHARAGQEVDEDISLEKGPLPQFAFSVEPQLRKLGLPTKLEKGVIELVDDFTVCKAGDKLNPEQAKILKLLDHKLSHFQVNLIAHWSADKGLTTLYYDTSANTFFKASTTAAFFSTTTKCLKEVGKREIRFSETAAYQGVDRRSFDLKSEWKPDYYQTHSYRTKKLLSALLSLTAVIIWIGCIREESDLDAIFNTPPHLITAGLERKMLKEQIQKNKRDGKDTSLLQAELEYVDVKEAALKAQFSKK